MTILPRKRHTLAQGVVEQISASINGGVLKPGDKLPTESAIMETIKDLMRGRTTIIITHRIATIHNVDQIVVLEGGRVAERGRGPELVARGGVYAKLYASGKFNT